MLGRGASGADCNPIEGTSRDRRLGEYLADLVNKKKQATMFNAQGKVVGGIKEDGKAWIDFDLVEEKKDKGSGDEERGDFLDDLEKL